MPLEVIWDTDTTHLLQHNRVQEAGFNNRWRLRRMICVNVSFIMKICMLDFFSGGKGNEFFWIDKIYERKSLSGHLYFDRKNLKTLTPFLHFCEIWGVWLQKTWASRTLARYLYNYPDKERWDWRKRVACPEQSRRAMREVWRPLKAVARTLIIYKLSSKGVKVLRWFC